MSAVGPPDPGFFTTYVTPSLAAGGFFLGLWNAWRAWKKDREDKLDKANERKQSLALKQFEKLREPINACLSEFERCQTEFRALAKAGSPGKALVKHVERLNKEIGDIHGRLETATRLIDDSRFADGRDWQSSYSADFDLVGPHLNACYNYTVGEKQIEALRQVDGALDILATNLRSRMDAALESYANSRPRLK